MGGHVAAALHKDALLSARIDFPRRTGNSKSGAVSQGTAAKSSSTDTWCDHHRLFYPASAKHDSKSCRAKGAAEKRG